MTTALGFISAGTYWLLIGIWGFILLFYIRQLRLPRWGGPFFTTLFAILAIDAFRTLFESLYFGAWYTSVAGLLPGGVAEVLMLPQWVIIPKLANLVAAVLVLVILFRRWIPQEKEARQAAESHTRFLEAEVAMRTRELRQAFAELKSASLETIHKLSRAAEFKDEETGAHIQRMSNYAAAIARRLGLGKDEVEAILYAAPMHDVGKIAIPDSILLKPAKLDPDEWEIMKQHTVIGGRILHGSSSEIIRTGEIIALTHHEKWDGSGYPKGMKGAELPIAGRITAIADVFDALTSKRPYKPAFSIEEALAIIRDGRGSHFDPDVADAFLSILDEILSIKEYYAGEETAPFGEQTLGSEWPQAA